MKRLRFESLEQRRVLTGNVLADFDGGKLEITGDHLANEIDVDFGLDEIVILGLSDTMVNGSADPVTFLRGGDVDVVVKLKKGDDVIGVSGTIEGDADIDTSKGNDAVHLGPLSIGGDLKIETHKGDDSITATDPLHVSGDTDIKMHKGDDELTMFFADMNFGEDFSVDTAQGDDEIRFLAGPLGQLSIDIGGDLEIKSGDGDDDVRMFAANFVFGPGPSAISVGGDMKVDLGKGNDIFETESTSFFGDLVVEGDLEIKGEKGDDLVTLVPVFGSIFVGGDLKMDGGSGYDGPFGSTVLGAVTVLGDTEVKDFESGV